jgi:hypothetical protein
MRQVLTTFVGALLALLVLSPCTFAQDKPYSLKGFSVGEANLRDFKAQFRHCADICDDKAVKKYGVPPKFAPFCSDDYPEGRLTPGAEANSNAYTQAGLVYCQPYFPFEEQRDVWFTIADIPTTTQFEFYQNKLYRISATFYASRFAAMQEALAEKYGPPSSATSVEYQNAFGAKFTGSVVTWDNGVSTITLRQYGSNSLEYSGLLVEHKSLAVQAATAIPKQSSKDL